MVSSRVAVRQFGLIGNITTILENSIINTPQVSKALKRHMYK